jgi:hypothetical protein
MASNPSVTAETDSTLPVTVGQSEAPLDASCEPLSCVISISLDDCRHYACGHCGGENKPLMWTGTVKDSTFESDEDVLPTLWLENDNTPLDRAVLLFRLGMIAQAIGYTHCELRDYTDADSDGYVPLYGGPIPEMTLMHDRA